tara:strand:+ start:227 stop:529 length:303 start_codon:yes stop_codon:yes gene_type:complete
LLIHFSRPSVARAEVVSGRTVHRASLFASYAALSSNATSSDALGAFHISVLSGSATLPVELPWADKLISPGGPEDLPTDPSKHIVIVSAGERPWCAHAHT